MRTITHRWGDMCTRHYIMHEHGIVMVDVLLRDLHSRSMKKGDALLWSLVVEAEYRRRGLGLELMRAAEEIAKNANCPRIYLEWSADIDRTPRWVADWYQRIGYKQTIMSNGYLLMGKRLKGV